MGRINIPLFLLIAGLITVIIAPYILTQCSVGVDLSTNSTSNIGDTIGGTTAPIIGIVSIFLIYFTYSEQRKSYKSLEKKRNFDILYQHLKDTLDLFYNLEYQNIGIKGHEVNNKQFKPIFEEVLVHKGKMALNYFQYDLSIQSVDFKHGTGNKFEKLLSKTYLNELLEVINSLHSIVDRLHKYDMLPNEIELLDSKIKRFYQRNLKTKLSSILNSISGIDHNEIRLSFIKEQLIDLEVSINKLTEVIR